MGRQPRIAIIGAGIGGAAAALALAQRGFESRIFEQAEELNEVGAGLTVGPNANFALNALGLEDELDAIAKPTSNVATLDYKTGAKLAFVERGRENFLENFGAVGRHMHRADLHGLLLRKLTALGVELNLNARVTSVSSDSTVCEIEFGSGNLEPFDLVIASDGLKSVVRQRLFDDAAAEFTGYIAWRGLVDRRRVQHVRLDTEFATYPALGRLFARYPLRDKSLINYVAVARRDEAGDESWKSSASITEVLDEFSDFHPDVVDIIEATPGGSCMRWALHTRRPIKQWVKGGVALLGDAAHPMTPFLGMGAAMAIEDAVVLARCLERCDGEIEPSLRRYQTARLPRANRIHRHSLARGEATLGGDAAQRGLAPGVGLEEIYRYDASTCDI